MAVHYVETEGQKWMRFARATACGGVDYNAGETAHIDARWAAIFATQGRGEILTVEEVEAAAASKAKAEAKAKADADAAAKAAQKGNDAPKT